MRGWRLAGPVLAVAMAMTSTPALATGYDISLAGLIDPKSAIDPTDTNSFQLIATDLGLTLQPRFSGPASTVGSLGFDMGYNHVSTNLTGASLTAWSKAVPVTLNSLDVSQIHVRKGLPFSFELGCAVSHIHDSRLWGVAFEIKTAFVEGYKYVPDIGTRLHISTVIGSRDLAMLSLGGDALISKPFGLLGVLQFTPYAGYSLTYVYATSHVVGRFYGTETAPVAATIADQHLVVHRVITGAALRFSAVEVAFEMVRNDDSTTTGIRIGAIF